MATAVQFALVPSFAALEFADETPLTAAVFHVLKSRNREDPPGKLAESITKQTGATTVGDLRKLTDADWRKVEAPAVARIYLKYVVRQSARKEAGDRSFLQRLADDFNYGAPLDLSLFQANVEQLTAMGFAKEAALEALVITENRGLEPALELLFNVDRAEREKAREEAARAQGRRLEPSYPKDANGDDPKTALLKRQLGEERSERKRLEVALSTERAATRLREFAAFVSGITASEQVNVAAAERYREEKKRRGINDAEEEQALRMCKLTKAEFDGMKTFSGKGGKGGGGGGGGGAECVVCLDAVADHVIMNCMHLCVCESCAPDFSTDKAKCPLCSKRVRKVVKIFT